MLQQHLPFTVLKPNNDFLVIILIVFFCCNSTYRLRYWNLLIYLEKTSILCHVATALTVYGIETFAECQLIRNSDKFVATALTVYGIETEYSRYGVSILQVATALTVYGIETCIITLDVMNQPNKLQQHLPFTVLKRHHFERF